MKKIIELATMACDAYDNYFVDGSEEAYYKSMDELSKEVYEYRKLELTPITEDWLKEHGWKKNEYRGWEYDIVMDDGRTEIRYYRSGGEPTATMSIYKNIDFEDEVCYELPEPYSLADLYDALDLCGIKID